MKRFTNISGLTFIEVIVALAINVILLSALLAVFSANLNQYNRMQNSNTLNQQLQVALDLMANDIRRAGYWGNASSDIGTGANNNPFMVTGSTDITVSGGNCILFTYDRSGNGSLATISSASDDERYGFRLSNQTLQARPPGATFACNAAANAWENLTDSTVVQITNLSFTLSSVSVPAGATTDMMLVRSVAISITGRLVSDTSVTKTLTEQVRIRNDKFVP